MEWNAKLDWAEELYVMMILLPVPVIVVAGLWFIAPWLQRRRQAATIARRLMPYPDSAEVSGKTAGEKT